MSNNHNARVAVVICTPLAKVTGPTGLTVYDPISPLWHRARMGLSLGTNINSCEICVDGLEVGDARSKVAARCLEMKPRPRFLFFIDSDVIVPNDAFAKLFYHLKTKPHLDVAAGVYVVKGVPPYDPLIYTENGEGAFWDWAVGDMLTTKQHNIRAVHMGLTLIRVDLLQRMKDEGLVHGDGTDQDDEPFFCTQRYEVEKAGGGHERFAGTEDIYFFHKARKLQTPVQLLVDTSVLGGHHDKSTGITYGLPGDTSPIERARWLPLPDGSGRRKDRMEADGEGLKLAIDLGAGSTRRSWPGHRTYTLDARRESGCDYCQELGGHINLPSDHYDLVASNHTVEHVPRWRQDTLWKEMFRICKPGGSLEVCVPNVQWAAEKIAAGDVDAHVLNVLYGSQDADTEIDSVEWNCHHMGFTPELLKAVAEAAGFVDLVTESWQEDPEMTYHLVLRGRKPSPVEPAHLNGEQLKVEEPRVEYAVAEAAQV